MSRGRAARRLGAKVSWVAQNACPCDTCLGTAVAFCDRCGQGLSQAGSGYGPFGGGRAKIRSKARCERCGSLWDVEFFWTGGCRPCAVFPGPRDTVLWVNGTGTVDLLWGSVHTESRRPEWLLESGRIIHTLKASVYGCHHHTYNQKLLVIRYPLAEGRGIEVATSLGAKLRTALNDK